ncbi:MAG TPA: Gfo/Idh/MocA family oxidoreductase [Planctomycetota bacterium]|nr:Gfo/Idh/MocA family oxidoreductase [Planctomycetota bacterium]
MPANNRCNVGFIGCGQLMTGQHIQNTHHSKINRIHTLCDIDEPKMLAVAKQYPPLKTTTDYKQLLADPQVQLVVIAMNPERHAALAIEALRAGKDVYVEKPMGVSVAEARDIARTAIECNRRVTTGFNRRFAPAYMDIKPYLQQRQGGLTVFYRIADLERWQRHDSPRLLHEIVHIFDILSYFIESEPVGIYVNQGWHPNDNLLTLNYADKSVATILSTGRTGCIPKERVELHWDMSAIEVESFVEARYYHVSKAPLVKRFAGRISDKAGSLSKLAADDGMETLRELLRESTQLYDDALAGKITKRDVEERSRGYIEEKGWAQALDEMGLSILENRKPTNATPTDGIRSIVLAEAAYESLKTCQAVTLNPSAWQV